VTQQVAIAGLAMAGAFFALSPFLLVEPLTAWRDITANRQIVVDRAVATGAFGPAGRYLDMLLRDAIGPLAAVLGLVGVIWMTFAAPARALFLLAFPVPFLMFIANTAPASRYLNPVLPFVTVFAAWTIAKIAAAVGRAGAVAFWVGIAAASTPALMSSVTTVRFLRMDDTRTLARHYIDAHIPDGTTILTQPYSAALTPSRAGLVEALTHNLGSADAASIKFRIQLALDPYPSPSYRQLYLGRGGLDAEKIYVDPTTLGGLEGLAPLRRLGVAYVLVTRYNKPDPGTLPFLAALTREGRRVAEFSPYRQGVSEATRARVDPFLHNTDARIDEALERPGPPLEIWQLNAPGTHGR
jgi:hypothetical protein